MAQNKPKNDDRASSGRNIVVCEQRRSAKATEPTGYKTSSRQSLHGDGDNIGSNRRTSDVASRGRLHPKGPYHNTRRGHMIE